MGDLVIPREGVESHRVRRVRSSADNRPVIPREGVESDRPRINV